LRSDEEDDAAAAPDASQTPSPAPERLITGVQGLLEPSAVAALPDVDPASFPVSQTTLASRAGERSPVDDAELRLLRRLMNVAPVQAAAPVDAPTAPHRSLRMPLLFCLLALGLLLPILVLPPGPSGAAHVWPGVADAFSTVQALPPGAHVLTYWAYDPATAGEMDFVVEPILTHLVEQQSQLIVASPLPGGMPLFARELNRVATAARLDYLDPLPVEIGFLPGGSAVLPLLGQDWPGALDPATAAIRADVVARPVDLSLVVTARAEEAQRWLEQVQPLNRAPVIVVSSAAAGPMLRPYVDSGQVRGLVSGFDGSSAYWSLLTGVDDGSAVPATSLLQLRRWLVYQNWGHGIVVLVIVAANIHALLQRRRNGRGTSAGGVRGG
jgi:hypothetical protein